MLGLDGNLGAGSSQVLSIAGLDLDGVLSLLESAGSGNGAGDGGGEHQDGSSELHLERFG